VRVHIDPSSSKMMYSDSYVIEDEPATNYSSELTNISHSLNIQSLYWLIVILEF